MQGYCQFIYLIRIQMDISGEVPIPHLDRKEIVTMYDVVIRETDPDVLRRQIGDTATDVDQPVVIGVALPLISGIGT